MSAMDDRCMVSPEGAYESLNADVTRCVEPVPYRKMPHTQESTVIIPSSTGKPALDAVTVT